MQGRTEISVAKQDTINPYSIKEKLKPKTISLKKHPTAFAQVSVLLASVFFWPLLIIESVARVSQHVLFTHDLLVK